MSARTELAARTGTDLTRATWVADRMRELPKYCIFLYNLLLDQRLPWIYKEHAFSTLRYIFEENGIIPDDDPMLGRLDDLAFTFRCLTELVARLPAGVLAIYEEVLHREGIPVRAYVAEAPLWLDKFYHMVSSLYRQQVDRLKDKLGNCIKTGQLVRQLQHYLENHKPEPWSMERLIAVEAFLQNFAPPRPLAGPAPGR